MAELGIERPPPVSHSELTAGHDVTQLLSQINDNLKQSKADQILRLLRDQDKISNTLNESFADDAELIKEYEQIREEKVICDSDTLTDSSSDSEDSDDTVGVQEANMNKNKNNNNNKNSNKNISNVQGRTSEVSEGRAYRRHRARTSVGFHSDMTPYDNNHDFSSNENFDTRDLSIRPKSSYVRRHQYRKKDDSDAGGGQMTVEDYVEPPPPRPKSARPKSRLGRASVPRSERTIALVEADTVPTDSHDPTKEELTGVNNMYDRFSSVRQPKRESKRAKAFCDLNTVSHENNENIAGVSSVNIVSTTPDSITDRQTIISDTNVITNTRGAHVSSFPTTTSAPRTSPVQMQSYNKRTQTTVNRTEQNVVHSPHQQVNRQLTTFQPPGVPVESSLIRSDTTASNATVRSEKRENVSPNSQIPLKRNNSNLGDIRPRNPEPVTSRPLERPDIRPSTRTRRLHRRYMAPTQTSHMSSNRPTSESVILARQKTEKNLLKKQTENRPHSEKLIVNSQNKSIDVSLNPMQGPQTLITSKGGVTQASHVQGGGFRGYDPGSKLKSSTQARDLPGDLTLPRHGQNSMLVGGRKPLAALMKLPPLEASLAAKKKERGLTLAARETCV